MAAARRTCRGYVTYLGVRMRRPGKYVAEIRILKTKGTPGLETYSTAEEAARVFDAAARRVPNAMTNFPPIGGRSMQIHGSAIPSTRNNHVPVARVPARLSPLDLTLGLRSFPVEEYREQLHFSALRTA